MLDDRFRLSWMELVMEAWDMFREDDFIAPPLMTVSEAARYMGVGKNIIYQLIEFGELKATRKRGAVLIEKRSLDEFRRSGKLT